MELKLVMTLIPALHEVGKPFVGKLGEDSAYALNAARLHGRAQLLGDSHEFGPLGELDRLEEAIPFIAVFEGEFELNIDWLNPRDSKGDTWDPDPNNVPYRFDGFVVNIFCKPTKLEGESG